MRFPLGDQPRDLAAALEARIDEPERLKPRKRRAIFIKMRTLAPHRLLELDAKPRQILVDRLLVVRPAARLVDVLDPQKKPPARRPRQLGIEQRGERMPKMQIAVRARREAEDGCGHRGL